MSLEKVVFFGGASSERRVSVATAQNVGKHLERCRFWFQNAQHEIAEVELASLLDHKKPFTEDFSPKKVLRSWPNLELCLKDPSNTKVMIFNAFHGGDGENGAIQEFLELRRVPFTGSGSQASRTAISKTASKVAVTENGVTVAQGWSLPHGAFHDGTTLQKLRGFLDRWDGMVFKPVSDGSSVGLYILREANELETIVGKLKDTQSEYMVEPLLIGRELTVGVMDRPSSRQALPASEVITEKGSIFDYDGKYLGKGVLEVTPADISSDLMAQVQNLACRAHQAVGCYGYSRTDFIVTANGPVFLEINTLPGMSSQSFFPQQLHAAGVALESFLEEQFQLASLRY